MTEKNRLQLKFLSCVMAVICGFWLIAGGPGRSANKAVDEARELTELGFATIMQFEAAYKVNSGWYRPEYLQPIQELDSSGRDSLARAKSNLTKADDSSRKKKQEFAKAAKAATLDAQAAIARAQTEFAELEQSVSECRKLYEQVIVVNTKVSSAYADAVKRVADESSRYLSKYQRQNADALALAQTNLDNSAISLKQAEGYLPEAGTAGGTGDPRQAEKYLAEAQKLTDAASTATFKVVSTLDLCREAESQATVKFTAASQSISQAEIAVNELLQKSGLSADKSFKQSYADISQAQVLLVEASAALKMVVEDGKYDYPLSFTNSLQAIKLSIEAQAEAKRQVAGLENSRTKRAALTAALAKFDSNVAQAQQSRRLLQNHSAESWLSVSNSIEAALQAKAMTEKLLVQADEALAGEQFETAIAVIDSGLTALSNGDVQLNNLIDLAAVLEEARRTWPVVKSQAENMIRINSSQIREYGDYSGSAKADFDAAESDLNRAQQEAASRNFQVAVQLANEAHRRADGTGNRAEEAYDDYQARKRREAQDALDALNSRSSSSSDDSSSSSSSWGGSDYSSSSSSSSYGGSSYDGGGYSSSSSSYDGGGYSSSSSGGNDGGGY